MNVRAPLIFLLALAATAPAWAQDASKVDDTAINKRDRHAESLTPMDQPNNADDIRVAAAVRKALVADSSLSTSARNVKLVAARGTVTLRGPVKTAEEKTRVEAIVKGVAGVTSVQNQLDIEH
ncbi:BON domain-containing protein [Luteibacter jiangsuensis]